jgi:hypothetical protein
VIENNISEGYFAGNKILELFGNIEYNKNA